ncbi:MAG: D-alanine--D-alanine ligase [Myxococcota bacterium]|nr:D-alanine--D-alanine ligase [Myxococcota bacterium]
MGSVPGKATQSEEGRSAPLRIGLVYDLLGSLPPDPDAPPDADAEFEPLQTVEALEAAIREIGARPVRLGSARDLLGPVAAGDLAVDAVWNIAESSGSRNREAWAPVLLEMAGIPTLGSDPLTLSLTLDKAWAKDVVAAAGVRVPDQRSWRPEDLDRALESDGLPGPYPLFVKPRWEGTAKGIQPGSKVADEAALRREVTRIARDYDQPALVEPFLPGAEYTVAVIGTPPRCLPVLQRALERESGIGLHALERHAPPGGHEHETPGALDPELEATLAAQALRAFEALACLDFARVDFRLDADGTPHFLEINPLPTFAPDGSFGVHAELLGVPLARLLGDVLREGLIRLGVLPAEAKA